MTRKLKMLGTCLVAVFALSAVVASAASADNFTSAKYPAVITGVQEGINEFTTTDSGVECEVAKFTSNSVAAASTTLTLTPVYEKCLIGGLIPAIVDMNGCDYLFHLIGATTNVSADVVCPAGKVVDITVPSTGCTITIGSQNGLTNIVVSNASPSVKAAVKVTKIIYTQTAPCPGGAKGPEAGATYEGNVKLTGNNGVISVD